jgi:protein TonB
MNKNENMKRIIQSIVLIILASSIIAQVPSQTVVFKVRKKQVVAPKPEEITVAEVRDIGKVEEGLWIVEENASFEGGDVNTFNSWIKAHTVYPKEAAEVGASGKVLVQFAVNGKGDICDAKVVRGVDLYIDKEAIRVIQSSPKWVPAKQGGKPVKQNFILPIVYQLQ